MPDGFMHRSVKQALLARTNGRSSSALGALLPRQVAAAMRQLRNYYSLISTAANAELALGASDRALATMRSALALKPNSAAVACVRQLRSNSVCSSLLRAPVERTNV